MVMPKRGPPPAAAGRAEPRRTADFAAAAEAADRPSAPDGQFEIPAFLRREAAASAPAAEGPKPVVDVEPRPLESGLGRLVYSPPDTMRAFGPQLVTVRILRHRDASTAMAAAFAGLGGHTPRAPDAAGSASLTVQLGGPGGAFRIEPRSPLLQILDARRSAAEWAFLVTPLRTGVHELELVVAACRAVGGQIETEEPEAVGVRIHVSMDWRRFFRRLGRAAAAAAIIALVTWLLTLSATRSSPTGAATTIRAVPASSP